MLRFGAMSRDLVGYGLRPPDVKWPNDARLTISLVLNYEEGAELCVGDGDPEGERVGEFVYPSMDSRTRDLGIESTFEYGARVGAWRVLRIFDNYGVKATIYACGRALERNPVIAREFSTRGHETAGHGYRWADHFRMSRDHERDQIRGPGWSGAGEFCEYLRDSVDYLRREGKTTPRLLSIGLHGRIIGRPGRAMALERFLEYCRPLSDVWFARRVDIARWWREHYAP